MRKRFRSICRQERREKGKKGGGEDRLNRAWLPHFFPNPLFGFFLLPLGSKTGEQEKGIKGEGRNKDSEGKGGKEKKGQSLLIENAFLSSSPPADDTYVAGGKGSAQGSQRNAGRKRKEKKRKRRSHICISLPICLIPNTCWRPGCKRNRITSPQGEGRGEKGGAKARRPFPLNYLSAFSFCSAVVPGVEGRGKRAW